jgi:hypothetical protein
MTNVLDGVARDDWAKRPDAARTVARTLALNGQVAYRVIALSPAPDAAGGENRANARRRTRLRSAKLLDSSNRFLCECLVYDHSSSGLRLKLMRNAGLPSRLRLFDDESGELRAVSTVWRRETLLGVRYNDGAEPPPLKKSTKSALRGSFYAVPD